MANAIIADNRLVTASGVTLTHSTEVSGYPAENVQVFQPGDPYRTSVLDNGWIQANFPEVQLFDFAGALYTNATAHHNLLSESGTLNTSPWTQARVTVTEGGTGELPVGGLGTNCDVLVTVDNNTHALVQPWTPPPIGGLTHTPIMVEAIVGVPSSQAVDEVRLRWSDTETPANQVYATFDLSAGTASATTTSGSNPPTSTDASITPLSTLQGNATWFHVAVWGTPATTGTLYNYTLYLMDGAGNISYAGSGIDSLLVSGTHMHLGSTLATAEKTTTAGGALFRMFEGSGDLTDWDHVVDSDRSDLPYIHLIHAFDSDQSIDNPRLGIHDPTNADGYIEVGNYVIASAFQPARNIDSGWSVGYAEEGGQNRSLGGQLYRPVNKRYRRLKMTHDWLTEAEAMAEALEIDRRVGRSEGVLAINNPGGTYEQETAIWGLQDTITEVMHKHYSTSAAGNIYRKGWHIVEALP